MTDIFEFDCPKLWILLNDNNDDNNDNNNTLKIDPWFLIKHDKHDKHDTINDNNNYNNKKRRRSSTDSTSNINSNTTTNNDEDVSFLKNKAKRLSTTSSGSSNSNPNSKIITSPKFSKPTKVTEIAINVPIITQNMDIKNGRTNNNTNTASSKTTTNNNNTVSSKTITNNTNKNTAIAKKASSTTTKNNSNDMKKKLDDYKQQKAATNNIKPKVSSTGPAKVNKPLSKVSTKTVKSDDVDMIELLKKHNKQFVKQAEYEPSRHSVRDVRKWEKSNGKIWGNLNASERELANKEIESMKSSS